MLYTPAGTVFPKPYYSVGNPFAQAKECAQNTKFDVFQHLNAICIAASAAGGLDLTMLYLALRWT
jgi:hypothetical protein